MEKTPTTLYSDPLHLNDFMYELITDIKALETMLSNGMLEGSPRRIGAEQELCLLDHCWRPAESSMAILKQLNDNHFTTEHSQYNLEINIDPLPFKGSCLSKMEAALRKHLSHLNKVVGQNKGHTILVGILPTIRRSDLNIEHLTPLPRYKFLNDILNMMKSGPYEFRIDGIDELMTRHSSIMFEGCNTSFQVHLQIDPASSANDYNWAQVIAGPVLAAATNSPMLLGKRLWHETRIALFQQSVDTRGSSQDLRQRSSRVTFGHRWLIDSITDIFKEDMARYRVLMGTEISENSLEALKDGEIPRLFALQLHNGTVYRWNRACYGLTSGKPHIRIENRYLPSGPTVADQMANAAFWLGLMNRSPKEVRVSELMDFSDVKRNFLAAATGGLETQIRWLSGKIIPVDKLILEELLPEARTGLEEASISTTDIAHYLGIIEDRVRSRQTGAHWILKSFAELSRQGVANYEACVAITAGIVNRQTSGVPVHKWHTVDISEAGDWTNRFWKVEHIMVSDLFTVRETDLVYFAANIMAWKHVRYVPVEDRQGKLVGLLTSRALLSFHSNSELKNPKSVQVGEIMIKKPRTVSPETLSIDALLMMRKEKIGCLPVMKNGRLVGIVTESDFMNFSELTIEKLVEESQKHAQREMDQQKGNVSGK